MTNKKPPVCATTETTTTDDGRFIRTALVAKRSTIKSVDVVEMVNGMPVIICRINIALLSDDDHVIVDVIDTQNRYDVKRALTFSPTERHSIHVPVGGNLVSVDFLRSK